jgi:arginine-tRNA-protein transferase
MSRNLVPDPAVQMTMPIYSQLIQHGFRRSGKYSYRPYCNNCQACISCRIPVNDFTASRSQKRCYKANSDLSMSVVRAMYSDEYFELYRRYLSDRHGDGSMANPAKEDFEQFLFCEWTDTRLLELRLKEKLVAVAVTDIASSGLSAVYSYFEPELGKRSLGTFCILKQIDYAKQQGLEHLYLGYWLKNHEKMDYKRNFRPLELYQEEHWQKLENGCEKS